MLGGCLDDVGRRSGGCGEAVCVVDRLSGGCVGRLCGGGCLEGVGRLSGGCVEVGKTDDENDRQ